MSLMAFYLYVWECVFHPLQDNGAIVRADLDAATFAACVLRRDKRCATARIRLIRNIARLAVIHIRINIKLWRLHGWVIGT